MDLQRFQKIFKLTWLTKFYELSISRPYTETCTYEKSTSVSFTQPKIWWQVMEPQLEKAFKKTINQTTRLCICHKANKKGSFHFVSGGSLGNPLPLSKKTLNQIGGQLHFVQIH